MDAQAPDASGPNEGVARRWATIALAVAIAGGVVSIVALGSGIGAVLAIAAVVVALWVRLGLTPFGRSRATAALWIAALTLAAHFAVYTVLLLEPGR